MHSLKRAKRLTLSLHRGRLRPTVIFRGLSRLTHTTHHPLGVQLSRSSQPRHISARQSCSAAYRLGRMRSRWWMHTTNTVHGSELLGPLCASACVVQL